MSKKHIKLKDNKIIYASNELKYILSAFYFGYRANDVLKLIEKGFLQKLIDTTTKSLMAIGESWDSIPDDTANWGVVMDFINEQKGNQSKDQDHANRSGGFATTENDGRISTS